MSILLKNVLSLPINFGSLTNPVVAPNDQRKSRFPLITFAFILTLATGFVKKR